MLLILLGAFILLASICKHHRAFQGAKALFSSNKNKIYCLNCAHQILMYFFFASYLMIIIYLILDTPFAGELVTGIIFFFGSISVFISTLSQSSMLDSIRRRHQNIIRQNLQLTQTEDVTIFALAYLAETHDRETGKHLERTAKYVEIITSELRQNVKYQKYLTENYLTDIVKSAPLHDIGKVGVPDAILKKKGKLSELEFVEMKKHSKNGADILITAEQKLNFESYLKVAIPLVLYHHERWDGKGYPEGLAGEQIPLSARIMAVADVYDALRSKRCYKNAMNHQEACQIIRLESGKQFAPDIVDAFLKIDKLVAKVSVQLGDKLVSEVLGQLSGQQISGQLKTKKMAEVSDQISDKQMSEVLGQLSGQQISDQLKGKKMAEASG